MEDFDEFTLDIVDSEDGHLLRSELVVAVGVGKLIVLTSTGGGWWRRWCSRPSPRSLEFAKAIRTAQLHLNEIHMVLEVVVHVGGEFQGAIIIADSAQETFAKLVRVAYFAEEEGMGLAAQ